MFLRLKVAFRKKQLLASIRTVVCIVSITRPEPRVYQPDPPGADTRRPPPPPPWRGSSLFCGDFLDNPALLYTLRRLRAQCYPSCGQPPNRELCAHSRISPQIQVWDWCAILSCPHGGGVTIATGSEARHSAGVLAVLTDPILRDELDRVAAAVGVRVVHAGESAVGRKTWSAAAAVVARCRGCGPLRARCAAAPCPRHRAVRRRTRAAHLGGRHCGRRSARAEPARAGTRVDPRARGIR